MTTLGVIVVLWTVLPLLPHDAWWIRVFDFPRVQVAGLTAIILGAHLGVSGWQEAFDLSLAAALLACLGYQARCIAPYTPWHPPQLRRAPAASDSTHWLSLFIVNVLTPNRNADKLLQLVRETDPDVVLAVETDRWWESRLDSLEAAYPYAIKHPLDNLYGIHLYSRLELIEPQVKFLVEDDVPSVHAEVVLRSGHRVELHGLHPAPPSPTEKSRSTERDAELLMVAKAVDVTHRSVIVMGDLNDVAWSATTRLFQRISGLLDPRIGRGLYSTFHAKYRWLRWPLDHVFCSSDFTVVSLARLPDFGSDHFPMHAVLCHSPRASAVHEEPEADGSDHRWAAEKIEKVDPSTDRPNRHRRP